MHLRVTAHIQAKIIGAQAIRVLLLTLARRNRPCAFWKANCAAAPERTQGGEHRGGTVFGARAIGSGKFTPRHTREIQKTRLGSGL